MIGRDALTRLDTRGYWEIEIICWMPPARQQTPFSCILDGLQASSGATMGKRNLRFAYAAEVVRGDQPVVYVIRRPQADRARMGLVYELKDKLVGILSRIDPDRLEATSRDIASHLPDDLFAVREMTPADFTRAEALNG